MTKRKRILVTLPNQHWLHTTVSRVSTALCVDQRYRVKVEYPAGKPYVHNLNNIVQRLLSGNFDFWLSIDHDNPPMNNPLDLVELDKDIIGFPTPIWKPTIQEIYGRPWYFNAYEYDGSNDMYHEHPIQKGLQKVDAVGTGCFLIARRVFENLKMQKAPFSRRWNEQGLAVRGNDIAFCEKARRNGFEIWTHFDYPCDHYLEISMLDLIKCVSKMLE